MGADCKSVGLRLRRFESCTCHRSSAWVMNHSIASHCVSKGVRSQRRPSRRRKATPAGCLLPASPNWARSQDYVLRASRANPSALLLRNQYPQSRECKLAIDPLALGRRIIDILQSGRTTSTYKLATMHALIDCCMERVPGDPFLSVNVPIDELRDRVIELYWPQTRPLAWNEGRPLRQASEGSEILDAVGKFRKEGRARTGSSPTLEQTPRRRTTLPSRKVRCTLVHASALTSPWHPPRSQNHAATVSGECPLSGRWVAVPLDRFIASDAKADPGMTRKAFDDHYRTVGRALRAGRQELIGTWLIRSSQI
jgi:hypothetical protein